MKSLRVATIILTTTILSIAQFSYLVEGRFNPMKGFALDELTLVGGGRGGGSGGGELAYQPLTFSSHATNNGRFGNLLEQQQQTGGSSRQHLHQQQQPSAGSQNGNDHVLEEHLSRQLSAKRTGERKSCHPTKPFLCPSEDSQSGECIPIQYLCDGSSDCPAYGNSPGGYDEDPLLCTAAKRPPVEETANFLRTLITNYGPEYVEKLFGAKMSQALMPLGGPERVAIALSVSKTIEDFGKALHLMRGDIDHLRNVLVAVQTADGPTLKSLGIVRNSELADMKFFLEKLLSTGFLD